MAASSSSTGRNRFGPIPRFLESKLLSRFPASVLLLSAGWLLSTCLPSIDFHTMCPSSKRSWAAAPHNFQAREALWLDTNGNVYGITFMFRVSSWEIAPRALQPQVPARLSRAGARPEKRDHEQRYIVENRLHPLRVLCHNGDCLAGTNLNHAAQLCGIRRRRDGLGSDARLGW